MDDLPLGVLTDTITVWMTCPWVYSLTLSSTAWHWMVGEGLHWGDSSCPHSVCRSVCFCLSAGQSAFVCLQVSLLLSVCRSVCCCLSAGQSVFVCLQVSLTFVCLQVCLVLSVCRSVCFCLSADQSVFDYL